MKITKKGKKTIIELTEKELYSLLAAIDSANEAISHMESKLYDDVPKLQNKINKELSKHLK